MPMRDDPSESLTNENGGQTVSCSPSSAGIPADKPSAGGTQKSGRADGLHDAVGQARDVGESQVAASVGGAALIGPSAEPFSGRLAAARNSTADLGQLLEESRQYLLAVASSQLESGVRPKVAASDIVQETFVKAARAFEGFKGNSESELRSWLRRILLNRLTDQMRREHLDLYVPWNSACGPGPDGLVDRQLTPRRALDQKEAARQLEAALARMSADHQLVIRLRHFDRCSFAEIGKRMSRSEDAAEKLWCRAMKKLKEGVGWDV